MLPFKPQQLCTLCTARKVSAAEQPAVSWLQCNDSDRLGLSVRGRHRARLSCSLGRPFGSEVAFRMNAQNPLYLCETVERVSAFSCIITCYDLMMWCRFVDGLQLCNCARCEGCNTPSLPQVIVCVQPNIVRLRESACRCGACKPTGRP